MPNKLKYIYLFLGFIFSAGFIYILFFLLMAIGVGCAISLGCPSNALSPMYPLIISYSVIGIVYSFISKRLFNLSYIVTALIFFSPVLIFSAYLFVANTFSHYSFRASRKAEEEKKYSYIKNSLKDLALGNITTEVNTLQDKYEFIALVPIKFPVEIMADQLLMYQGLIRYPSLADFSPNQCKGFIGGFPDICIYNQYPNDKILCENENNYSYDDGTKMSPGNKILAYKYYFSLENCSANELKTLDKNKLEYEVRNYDNLIKCNMDHLECGFNKL